MSSMLYFATRPGIHSVEFDDGVKHIIAMKSLEGEIVPLKTPVQIVTEVEVRLWAVGVVSAQI